MAKLKYNEDFPLLAEMYAREGMRDVDICKKLGISKDTFYTYIKKYPDFSEAIKRGKAPVDFQVENAMLKRALGYDYEEETIEYENQDGKPAIKSKKTIKKHIPSDVGAGIFWLTNRNNDKWKRNRDVQKIEVSKDYDEDIVNEEIERLLNEKLKEKLNTK